MGDKKKMEKDNSNSNSTLIDLCKNHLEGFKFIKINKIDNFCSETPDFTPSLHKFLKNILEYKEYNLKNAPQGKGPRFIREREAIEKNINSIKDDVCKFHSFEKNFPKISDSINFYKKEICDSSDDTAFGSFDCVHTAFIFWDKTSEV